MAKKKEKPQQSSRVITDPSNEGAPSASQRRRGSREATRQRLVDAAIELIRQRGADELTTTSVTEAAGIVQSGFYMHFKNIDECKRAAAQRVADGVREFVAGHRRQSGQGSADDLAAAYEHYRTVMNLFLSERRFAELLLRCRHDRSALGEVLRELLGQIRTDLIADFTELAAKLQLTGVSRDQIAIYADLVLGMVMSMGEGLIEGRYEAPSLLAQELTAASLALCRQLAEGHGPAAGIQDRRH